MSEGLGRLAGIAKSAMKVTAGAIAGAGAALVGLAGKAVQVGTSFESSMSQVAATMGITAKEIAEGSKDYKILAQAAKDAGATTKYSAKEAADALNYLALAGYDAKTSADVLPSVLNLAAASGMDLAAASDLATDAMSALGIAASNKNLTSFGDKLAKTASKSNTSVSQLGEAILKCAGTAKGFGMSTETLTAELGVLANRGLKSAEAGTHLRNIILAFESPTSKAAKELKRLRIEATNSDGSFRDMNDIITDLNKSMSKMTDKQRAQSLSKIFNKTDLEAVNYLMAGLGDEYSDLYKEVSKCDGAMQDMADTMNDNLQGRVTILQSSLEGLGIQVYEGLEKPLKRAAEEATDAVGRLSKAFKKDGFNGLAEAIGNELGKAAAKAAEAAPKFINAGTDLIKSFLKGITDNSDRLASSGMEIGKAVINGIVEIAPQAAVAGLKIMAALARGIAGQKPAREIKKLANTVKRSFKEITSAVKSSVGNVKALLGNLITIAVKVINAAIKPLTKAVVFAIKNMKPIVAVLMASAAAMKANAIATTVAAKIKVLTAIVVKSKKAWAEAKTMMALFTTAEEIAEVKTALLSGSLTVHEIIVGVITGKIKLATLAQAAWNAVMNANPFILAATALAALAAGIGAYCLMTKSAEDSSYDLSNAMEKAAGFAQNFTSEIHSASDNMSDFAAELNAGFNLEDVKSKISSVQSKITAITSKASEERRGFTKKEIKLLKDYYAELDKLTEQQFKYYDNNLLALKGAVESGIEITGESANKMLSQAASYRDEAIKLAEQKYFNDLAKAQQEKSEKARKSAISKAETDYKNHLTQIRQTYGEIVGVVSDSYTQQNVINSDFYNDLKKYNSDVEAENQRHKSQVTQNQYEMGLSVAERFSKERSEKQLHNEKMNELNQQFAESCKGSNAEVLGTQIALLGELQSTHGNISTENAEFVATFAACYSKLPDDVKAEMDKMLEGMNLSMSDGSGKVITTVGQLCSDITQQFKAQQKPAEKAGKDTDDSYADGLKLGATTVMDAGSEVADSAIKPMGAPEPKAKAKKDGEETAESYKSGIESQENKAKAAGEDIADTAVKGMNTGTEDAKSAGKAIGGAFGAGIPLGIDSKIAAIKRKAANAVNAAIAAAEKAADINSPSKKTRDLVGRPLAEGIGVGMDKEKTSVMRKAAETTESIMARMRAAVIAQNAYMGARAEAASYSTSNYSTTNYNTSNTSYNPTLNFYQPVQTPSQAARAWRKAMEVRD